ncbi:MAG: protein translocase subunit SecY [Phycisphaerae bacterium]|nr:Protein translocase subunit SecY [Phycisphaerales bacterium]MCK6477815.1 preprotein translocase subunit SecY [Phycisphaerales bacterium]
MLRILSNVFRIPELRNKILFTAAMLVVYRLGYWIPIPGVSQELLQDYFNKSQQAGGSLAKLADFVNIFSGGNFSQSTIFGLGIMPYISASIIIQLFGTVMPQIKKLQEEGPSGRQKIMEWTRYGAVALCVIQGLVWLKTITTMGGGMVYPEQAANPLWWVMATACLTAGSVFLMWLGEQIDRFGIGNGVSMIIMAGIVARMPAAVQHLVANFDQQDPTKMGFMGLFVLIAGFVGVTAGAVLMTVAQRRIPIQQAKHTRGRRVLGGQKSYLPLRLNHSGVMPIVFASSLMIFPTMIFSGFADVMRAEQSTGMFSTIVKWLANNLSTGQFLHEIFYVAMIYFFAYFWITVQFNPEDMAKQLKEHGSFIPGLRPGPRTAEYLTTVITRITFVGAAFLSLIAVIPTVVNKALNVPPDVSQFLGGTGLLIVVSVALDFLQRVEANLLMRNYAGFLSGGDDSGPRIRGPRG